MENNLKLIQTLLIITIIAVIGITGVILWSRLDERNLLAFRLTPTNISSPTPLPPGSEVEYNCSYTDMDLCNFLAVITYRSPYFLNKEPGTVIFIEGEHVEENIIETDGTNIRLTAKRTGQETRFVIQIDDIIYYKTESESTWRTRPYSEDIVLSPMVMGEYVNKLQLITEYEKVGEEVCGDFNCMKYLAKNETDELLIYFDTDNYLLRKLVLTQNGTVMEHRPDYEYVQLEKPI